MKKALLISTLAVLASLSSYGQGTVNFSNPSTQPIRQADGTAVPRAATGGMYQAELLYAPDGASTDAKTFGLIGTRVGATTTFNTPNAGVFAGGNRTVQTITPPGGFGLFQVRVFDTRAGATYELAEASGNSAFQVGYSQVLRVDTGDPTITPAQTAAALGLTSFTLSPIPEPSVIGLGLLGAGALLMLRRRK